MEGWAQSSISLKNVGPAPQWCKLPQTSETSISWRALAQGPAACLDPVQESELYFCFAELQSVISTSLRTLSLWGRVLTPGVSVLCVKGHWCHCRAVDVPVAIPLKGAVSDQAPVP